MGRTVSAVIVSWNTRDILIDCLESLIPGGGADLNGIIVVDNASSDGTAEIIARRFPRIDVIRNDENRGFAVANNQAIRRSVGDYILLLNPDTVVKSQAVARLASFLDAHPAAGVAGPRLINPDGSLQISCYPFPTPGGELCRMLHLDRLLSYGTYDQDHWSINQSREVDTMQGACLLIRREVLDQVGLLDEGYFMYTEEIDLCYRIKKAGWKLFWVPDAEVVHLGGQSTRQVASNMFIHLYKSKMQFFRKHYGRFPARTYKLILLFASLLRLACSPLALLVQPSKRPWNMHLARCYSRLIIALPGL